MSSRSDRSGRSARSALGGFLTIAFFSFSPFAQEPPGGPPPRGGPGGPGPRGMGREKTKLVEKFDKDGDKRLDAAERKAAREFLRKERAAGRGAGGPGGPGQRGRGGPVGAAAPQVVSQADKDGDGKVTREEFRGLAEAWYDKLDPDKKGVLAPARGPGGPREGPPGAEAAFGIGPVWPGLFNAADANQDGSLTRSEFTSTFERWFTEWDRDKKGSLDEERIREGLNAVLSPAGFGGPRGGGFPGRRGPRGTPQPGRKLSPGDVTSFPGAPLYDMQTLRTFFLEFENTDWEEELADFKQTDVEVTARLTVDSKTYPDVGVRFRGMSSFGMVGEGFKRSFNISLDFVHQDQHIGGYRTLNLLNSNDDPTFLRAALYSQIAREYVPAPKVSFARVVINGESWGVYVNAQQFNKEFVKEWFGTTRGARWKVPGSPGGRGSLAYLGEDASQYKRFYEIKTKDDPQAWADLIRLSRVLNETPADRLEEALAPLLDIDGALKFLALENALVNNDGYWIRTSDYSIYQDEKGRFHLIPYDMDETFGRPGGPGFGGGFAGFGRGALAEHMLSQADRDKDGRLTRQELLGLGGAWFDRVDPEKSGKLSQERFTERVAGVLPPRQGSGPPGNAAAQDGGRESGPAAWIGPGLFRAADLDKDGVLTRGELEETFGRWPEAWGTEKRDALNEEELAEGLRGILPRPDLLPGGNPGAPAGGPGRVEPGDLDPLIAANDSSKPLLSKLLAVPRLRQRYLGYVRDIAEKWLDWQKLGPIAEAYHALIADEVGVDTRKLDSTEEFFHGLAEDLPGTGGPGQARRVSLKSFATARRAYLSGYKEAEGAGSGVLAKPDAASTAGGSPAAPGADGVPRRRASRSF